MVAFRRLLPVALVAFLIACGGQGPSNEIPLPSIPSTPDGTPTTPPPTTPTDPGQPTNPNPPPTNGTVPYYGEWIVTYTSQYDVSFVHALQVTTNVSTDGLLNAGGGLQEFCTGGGGDTCEGIYGSGIGFIGNLVLDDGTSPLTLGIATSYGGESPVVKIVTLEDIQMTTNSQGQQTFTAAAGWQLSTDDIDIGTVTATNVGPPKQLEPLNINQVKNRIERFIPKVKGFF